MESCKEELQMKLEKLQAMLDDERASFENQLAQQMAGWSDKATAMLQSQIKQAQEIEGLVQTRSEL